MEAIFKVSQRDPSTVLGMATFLGGTLPPRTGENGRAEGVRDNGDDGDFRAED